MKRLYCITESAEKIVHLLGASESPHLLRIEINTAGLPGREQAYDLRNLPNTARKERETFLVVLMREFNQSAKVSP